MIATDIGGAQPLGESVRPEASTTATVKPGTVHLAVPYTSRWQLKANGQSIPARPAFGLTNAYDVSTEANVELSFHASAVHTVLVLVQFVAWCVVAFIALSRRRRFFRRSQRVVSVAQNQSPVITMQGRES